MAAARPRAARLIATSAPIPALPATAAAEWPIWPRPKTSTTAREPPHRSKTMPGKRQAAERRCGCPADDEGGAGDRPPRPGCAQLQGLCGEQVPPGADRIETGMAEPDQDGKCGQDTEGEGTHVNQDAGKFTACVLHDTDKEREPLAWRGAPGALKNDARARGPGITQIRSDLVTIEISIRPASRRARCPRTGRRSRSRRREWH